MPKEKMGIYALFYKGKKGEKDGCTLIAASSKVDAVKIWNNMCISNTIKARQWERVCDVTDTIGLNRRVKVLSSPAKELRRNTFAWNLISS